VTARDRTVLIVVGFLALLGAFWMLALTPKRKEASDLGAQVTAAQERLDAANASAAAAETAKKRYNSDYATVARLGKAVPVEDDVPSLVYQLEHAAHDHDIDFRSIKLVSSGGAPPAPTGPAAAVASANGTTPAGTTSAVSAALPPGATVGTAGFPTMPFSFDFNGSFFDMQKFLRSMDALTTVQGKRIDVKGRLLTVDGVDLKAGPKGFPDVSATVAVTAYLLPADEGLTADATAGAAGSDAATVSTSSTAGAPATASLTEGDR
jgi:Tfp pilus assembly protein PilO